MQQLRAARRAGKKEEEEQKQLSQRVEERDWDAEVTAVIGFGKKRKEKKR